MCDATLVVLNHIYDATLHKPFCVKKKKNRIIIERINLDFFFCVFNILCLCVFVCVSVCLCARVRVRLAAYETTQARPHLALFTCLFLLMSFVGVAMYCTDRRRPQRACEELEAALAVYLLHMKQLVWGCWIWLTMQ